jgi:hypothetical protein
MKKLLTILALVIMAGILAFAAAQDGTWTIQGNASGAPHTLVFTVNGSTLTGTIDGSAISGGGVSGNEFWFRATRNNVAASYKGSVNGNQLTLNEYTTQTHTYTYAKNAN